MLAETCAFCHIISRGSGAIEAFNTEDLADKEALAAQVVDDKSRKVTKPVELIVALTTLSSATSNCLFKSLNIATTKSNPRRPAHLRNLLRYSSLENGAGLYFLSEGEGG